MTHTLDYSQQDSWPEIVMGKWGKWLKERWCATNNNFGLLLHERDEGFN